MIDQLIPVIERHRSDVAFASDAGTYTYGDLLEQFSRWRQQLADRQLTSGSVVTLEGEYGIETGAAFLALIEGGHIAVPLTSDSARQHDAFREIASAEWRIRLDCPANDDDRETIVSTGRQAQHEVYDKLRTNHNPGLVLFSSGSTGRPKAAVHDLNRLLAKYAVPKRSFRTLVFLLLDHIGGVNTLFYTLFNGGGIVTVAERTPASICHAIERYRVELLPTSPTFLNMLLLSGEHLKHDLSSLKLITYGTEPMPQSTLERVAEEFPTVQLRQTYGMTELGILRSESRATESLWVRVGGEDFETKVVDGRLRIRARCAMLGYLNAPSPFDDDGFFDTGDLVEVDGEWVRFLARSSDIVNIGGSKVYPAEVESVLLQMPNVLDVVVAGEPHPLTGQIVAATVRLTEPEPIADFKVRLRQFAGKRLQAYQIPARVRITTAPLHSTRFKRARGAAVQS